MDAWEAAGCPTSRSADGPAALMRNDRGFERMRAERNADIARLRLASPKRATIVQRDACHPAGNEPVLL